MMMVNSMSKILFRQPTTMFCFMVPDLHAQECAYSTAYCC